MKHFYSEPLAPVDPEPVAANEPQLPSAFEWRGERITVSKLLKTGRAAKEDRGDVYLKRHWFEFETAEGTIATVYFDRAAKRGRPHWWLYTVESLS